MAAIPEFDPIEANYQQATGVFVATSKLGEVLEPESELAEHIRKLEENYDNNVFDTQMGDLKEWLEERGIRVD